MTGKRTQNQRPSWFFRKLCLPDVIGVAGITGKIFACIVLLSVKWQRLERILEWSRSPSF